MYAKLTLIFLANTSKNVKSPKNRPVKIFLCTYLRLSLASVRASLLVATISPSGDNATGDLSNPSDGVSLSDELECWWNRGGNSEGLAAGGLNRILMDRG